MTPRRTFALTLVAWLAALTLLAAHLTGTLPLGPVGTGLWCVWLLTLGCVAFRITFLRASSRLIAEDWQMGRAFGDLRQLPVADHDLPELLAARDGDEFLRPSLWPVFGWIGAVCWGGAALYTAAVAGGQLRPRPSDLLLTLVTILAFAAQGTCAAVNGPPLTRQCAVRRAAALAHHRLREHDAETEAVTAFRSLAAREPARAEALLRNLTAQRRPHPPAELHLINGTRERSRHTGNG